VIFDSIPDCATAAAESPPPIIEKAPESATARAIAKVPFENKGFILHSNQAKRFSYTHLSSLSGLKDLPQNYSIVDFNIVSGSPETILELRLSNFPTESIYKHLVFYWNTTLGLLKTFIEKS